MAASTMVSWRSDKPRLLQVAVDDLQNTGRQINSQHGLQRMRLAPAAGLWVVRLDQRHQPSQGTT